MPEQLFILNQNQVAFSKGQTILEAAKRPASASQRFATLRGLPRREPAGFASWR